MTVIHDGVFGGVHSLFVAVDSRIAYLISNLTACGLIAYSRRGVGENASCIFNADPGMARENAQLTSRRRQSRVVGWHGSWCIALIAAFTFSVANAESAAPRTIPSRNLPVPDTVSPALQKVIGAPPVHWPKAPKTVEGWKALQKLREDTPQQRAEMNDKLGVTVVSQTVGGVPIYLVTPRIVAPGNRNRLLLSLHAGGFLFGAGESGLFEPMVMASRTGYKIIAIDYRTLPDHPFPAAMDDAMTVWKEIIKVTPPANIAVFGSSAGGAMVLSLVQRAKREGLPLPGALMSDSPWSDLSKTGDSYYTNAYVDSVFTSDDFWLAVAKLYANGRDLKDPQLSPVYGDFSGFPPAFLVSGTRDAFLSNTVRVQRKLLQAGARTQLVVGEGGSHAWLLESVNVDAPEAGELYHQIGQFFDEHLCH